MKPDTTALIHNGPSNDATVEAQHTMSVSDDMGDQAFMLQTMTNLYSDRLLAWLRELSTNAADSHVDAGQTRPIEVTLPGEFSPQCVIRDWGVGLDADDMADLFAKYGKSTKRHTNSTTGLFGLGCKSPLTYCDSFTVVGIKGGNKTTSVITKNEEGVGVVRIIDITPTDAPNGVSVTVPVKPEDFGRLREIAERFFSFWRGGILLDGQKPSPVHTVMDLDPDVKLLSYSRGKSYIVQGNVAYPWKRGDHTKPAVVAWVPMGSIKPTPSREEMLFNDTTEATLTTLADFIDSAFDRSLASYFAKATTFGDQIRAWQEIRGALPYRTPVNQHLSFDPHNLYLRNSKFWIVEQNSSYSEERFREHWVTDGYHFITNFKPKQVSAAHRERFRQVGLNLGKVVTIPDTVDFSPTGLNSTDWKDIPPLPRQAKSTSSAPSPAAATGGTVYAVYVNGNRTSASIHITDKPIVMVTHDEDVARWVSGAFDVDVAWLMTTQTDKYQRLHPTAVDWASWRDDTAKELVNNLSRSDYAYLDAKPWERMFATMFHDVADDFNDKMLKETARLGPSNTLNKLAEFRRAAHPDIDDTLAGKISNLRQTRWADVPDTLKQQYPLLMTAYGYNNPTFNRVGVHVDEWVLYANARTRKNRRDRAAAANQAVAS